VRQYPAMTLSPEATAATTESSRAAIIVLLVILVVGGALRVGLINVTEYSAADEQVYLNDTAWLLMHGWSQYPSLCQEFMDHPDLWEYPNPFRWGYLGLASVTCRLTGHCDQRELSWLSTIAGTLSVLLTFLLGRELLGTWVGVAAAGIACTSPLQLALGRRALQDEPYCAVVLLFLWLLVRSVRREPRRGVPAIVVLTILTGTFVFSLKESSLLLVPAALAMAIAARWPDRPAATDLASCLAPPVLFVLASVPLMGGASRLVQAAKVVLSFWPHAPYAQQYQGGPPHRALFDLFLLAPVACLLAAAAVTLVAHHGGRTERGAVIAAVGLGAILIVFSVLSSKNVRYVVAADPLIRILAAWVLVRGSLVPARWKAPTMAAMIALSAITELAIFQRVFVAAAVYDPVTESLLRALGAISH